MLRHSCWSIENGFPDWYPWNVQPQNSLHLLLQKYWVVVFFLLLFYPHSVYWRIWCIQTTTTFFYRFIWRAMHSFRIPLMLFFERDSSESEWKLSYSIFSSFVFISLRFLSHTLGKTLLVSSLYCFISIYILCMVIQMLDKMGFSR